MPTFENVETTTTVIVDFEVYCGTCGCGLCSESDTSRHNRRGYAVTVNACPDCMASKDNEIDELKREIEKLEKEIEDLVNSDTE